MLLRFSHTHTCVRESWPTEQFVDLSLLIFAYRSRAACVLCLLYMYHRLPLIMLNCQAKSLSEE
jgi:hypothetical protein